MHYKGHLAGAMASGTLSAAVAMLAGAPGEGTVAGLGLANWPGVGALPAETIVPALCFLIAGAMALFPDLDIGSIPQRWYLRAMFAAMAAAWWMDRPQIFTWLAFAALVPLLHRHRGWTHWPVTPWLIAAAAIWMLEARSPSLAGHGSPTGWEIVSMIGEYRVVIFAFVAGHYTHLLLDARRLGGFPFPAHGAKKR